jgi:hypothetical protein
LIFDEILGSEELELELISKSVWERMTAGEVDKGFLGIK